MPGKNRPDRTTPRTDVTVELTGLELHAATNNVTTTVTIRREINRLCKQPYTRALAWCLYVHADQPKMPVEDLFEWLDEIAAGSPKRGITWNDYHRKHRTPSQKLVSESRRLLRNNGLPCNH